MPDVAGVDGREAFYAEALRKDAIDSVLGFPSVELDRIETILSLRREKAQKQNVIETVANVFKKRW